MRSDLAAKGINPGKMTPIPGSLDLSRVPFKGDSDPGPSGKRILYIGTLIRERNLDFLIRVFAKVTLRHDDATLIFVGAGENSEDEALLRREMEKCGVEKSRVIFAGRVARDKVWRFIEESMVCLSPYYPSFILNSTSPTKLLEYMAMARPVVANEHPEQSLVVAESGAGICVPWSELAFVEAIERLLDDPELCKEMGANGHRWVEKNRSNRFLADVVEARYTRLIRPQGDPHIDYE